MVDAEAQTEPPPPATVVGVEQDLLIGLRVRKTFGPRAFWGSVVGCYWVSGGLFYKVSFDDGDVDICSADEVLQDAQAAKQHAKENPQTSPRAKEAAVDEYFNAMRQHSLKRKRDDVADHTMPNIRRVSLWGQRLYASIYTNEQHETFIKELLKTNGGEAGEMEATGQVKVGDMILAVNRTRVLGMTSRDLAELIRKPQRPIILTLYRPQPSTQQQQAQGERAQTAATSAQTQQVPQSTAASGAPTTTAQTQQPLAPAQPPQPAATVQAQQQAPASAPVMIPHSFAVSQPAFAHSASLAQGLAQQWTNTSQSLSNMEIIRQRLSQNVAARQAGYVPGYPMGVYMPTNAVPMRAMPTTHSGAFHNQQQYMQRVANSAAMRVTSGFSAPAVQPARPMYPPQTSTAAAQYELNMQHNQQRRTGLALYEKVKQLQAQRNSVSGVSMGSTELARPHQVTTADARTQGAQEGRFTIVSQNEPEQRAALSHLTGDQQDTTATSRQPPSQVSTSYRRSAENVPSEPPREGTFKSALSASTSLLRARDVEAIARLAEKNPQAAQHLLKGTTPATSLLSPNQAPPVTEMEDASHATSFLSPSALAANDERGAEGASHAMSFLSPNDFNVESSTPSGPGISAGSLASQPATVKSNVSIVTVKVSRSRLYLTLGVQGTLIAVTSFVQDEFGRPGEVEQSGKVFLGDVLVRINESNIVPGMTPTHVADIVNSAPRPMALWFERASWDILDGKA
ncbi:hypothetical protein PHYPSEUDO_007075 [Phytophthora pseudosyringae]|uniref:PDZ domain-containing protein n=1 Tax=Phytophthora pseudosyringae TaxID=221518 RepID=A0A8T1VGU3_9STRA|nr:hypothetical protein PHYPSEUDO_007075 [Phytophthora pseudosyringae]